MNTARTIILGGLLMTAALLAGTAQAQNQSLPRLKKELAMPRSGDSPGKVLFRHESHVEAKTADCTRCHPKMFRMTETGKTASGEAITHEQMRKGQYCGACHDDKKAFGLESCENCHTAE